MPEPVVIPTLYKTKLPKALSYPLGAELISGALTGVPQFEYLKVRFWFYPKESPTVSKLYHLLKVSYSYHPPNLTTGKTAQVYGWLEKQWEITVTPVPRERRHLIKGLLEQDALPIVRKWLIENADRDEFGGLNLVFAFDEETETLKIDRDSWLSPKQA